MDIRVQSESKRAAIWAMAAAAALAAAQWADAGRGRSYLGHFGRPPLAEHALTDVTAVLMGVRRLGADLAFVQMLQYYASADTLGTGEAAHEEHAHGHGGPTLSEGVADLHPETRLPFYPNLEKHFLRMAELDPYFHYAYLFGAGALAFNLNRADEAVRLLELGSACDPSFWQFRLYAGAIAFRRSAQMEKVIGLLEEAVRYPDCPTMLENILANIHKKRGNYRRAAELFAHILQTSRDEGYVMLARQRLSELEKEHGVRLH